MGILGLIMAKWIVGRGLDEYLSKLGNLAANSEEMCKMAGYEGAAVVADAIRANIQALPVGQPKQGKVTAPQKAGLLDGFGISPFRNDSGYIHVKIGMDGYNSTVNKIYPKGQPNAMIARSLESGNSKFPKHPFIGPAVNKSKKAAEEKMKLVIDQKIYAIMEE